MVTITNDELEGYLTEIGLKSDVRDALKQKLSDNSVDYQNLVMLDAEINSISKKAREFALAQKRELRIGRVAVKLRQRRGAVDLQALDALYTKYSFLEDIRQPATVYASIEILQ